MSKMEFGKRKTFQIQVRESKIDNLKTYDTRLSKNIRNPLNQKYGRILDLLTVPVQQEALIDLAQFYDSTLRCFHFQDFQLTPTIEEFNNILEIHKPAKGPFKMIGYHPSVEEMAYQLNIHDTDLQANLRVHVTSKDSKGII